MNAFERHGINNLSASSLNLWRSAPGIWALRYVAKIKDESPAAWRGDAVEHGLNVLLRSKDIETAIKSARRTFAIKAGGEISEAIDEEDELIEPMLRELTKWEAPGALNATQLRVEHWLDGVPVPLIGYLDFAFLEGPDVDLKTTKACPSSPKADHLRQVSLYRAARKREGGLLYVTPKKHQYYPVDDEMVRHSIADLTADAISLNNFLGRCPQRGDVLRSLPIDYDNFRAPKTRVPLANILDAG